MQLTDEQKQQVAQWIAGGLKLSAVQDRLEKEFGVRLTYMETRFLMDDLQVTPQDAPEPAPAPLAAAADEVDVLPPEDSPLAAGGTGKVRVKVDDIMRPGAVVSGTVTFSDGVKSVWYMDQMGRLGMQPEQPGYRPPESDVAEFQIALERELVKLGM